MKDPAFDKLLTDRYSDIHRRACNCELSHWRDDNLGRLAEIIVIDQFSRCIYRNSPAAFAHDPLVLPMPLPDLELLEPYEGKQEGVLFIGRHEPRKNPKLFAKAVAEAGLPAKVLTNKRGMKKFEKTLAEAGVESFDIRYELTGSQKTDFIKSARIAFHPANLESYGFSAMETLAAGLPTVLIEEYRWWRAFEHAGVITAPKDGIVQTLADLHHSPDFQSKFDWLKHENKFQEDWLTLLS